MSLLLVREVFVSHWRGPARTGGPSNQGRLTAPRPTSCLTKIREAGWERRQWGDGILLGSRGERQSDQLCVQDTVCQRRSERCGFDLSPATRSGNLPLRGEHCHDRPPTIILLLWYSYPLREAVMDNPIWLLVARDLIYSNRNSVCGTQPHKTIAGKIAPAQPLTVLV